MKRSTARWTTSLAAAALLGLPTAGLAQTSATTPPHATTAQQPATAPSAQPAQNAEAQEHLRQAKAALDSVTPTAVTGKAKTQLAELKRTLTALERTSAAKARGNASWGTQVAAADKILTSLLGPTGTTGSAADPTATTGTSGSTASKTATAVTLDEATRTQLMEVRTHVTAFAAAMSGTSADAATAAPASGSTSTTGSTMGTMGSTMGSTTGTTSGSTTGAPTAAAGSTASTAPAQSAAAQPPVSQDASRRHLTEARDTLAQLTQLPAAAQLSGDARTHVSQLISNFNELITTQTEWRSSYAKVDANLTALLGPNGTDAEAAGSVSTGTTGTVGTTGTTGTAGTSGTAAGVANLDPAIRAKLTELRNKLNEFERAAGGDVASSDAPSTSATDTTPGQTASPQTATAQSGTSTPEMGHQEAMRHIAAIEAILNANGAGTPAAATSGTTTGSTTGTTGSATSTTPSTGTGLTLTSTQLEQLRTHLTELKRLVGEAKK